MKLRIVVSSLCIGVCCFMILSCKQVENFPVIPQITFESLKTYGYDSAICKITFVDGDGDIGLDPFMTQPPFDTTSRYYNDLFLKLYWDSLGIWKVGLKPNLHTGIYDTIQSRFRIPNLTPNGQAKALKGEIKVKLFAPYSIPGQRFKYSIRLYDRALHASNIVESDAQPAPY